MKKHVFVAALALLLCFTFSACDKRQVVSNPETPVASSSSEAPVSSMSSEPAPAGLDPHFSCLLLVNPDNALPLDYDSTNELKELPAKYLNGELKQVDAEMYPYLMAMLEAAWANGIELYVRSPYRSYATQKMLFENKIQRVIKAGTPESEAEAEAAKVVARPGTSEHQSGLAVDFNSTTNAFETMPQYDWLKENAEDYGFIMRYPSDKEHITKIIYEPWHWRFVGIDVAREMNSLDVTLEEYLENK